MKKEDLIYGRRRYGEKSLEHRLVRTVKDMGGEALKFYNPWSAGYPDRLILLPGGIYVWAELKSTGKAPTRLQDARISRLRALGDEVYVVDGENALESLILRLGELTGENQGKKG